MRFGSVCSGIEAASAAWHPLGWRASFLSEIEAFPRAVLSHHFPTVPLHGDFTTIEAGQYDPIDLLVGGTPCQSFSVAGLRGGLADERGNLALEYLRLAQRLRPRWLVWENVPGVLSSFTSPQPPGDLEEGEEWEADETSDFGSFLSGLSELGYGFAYRVLDAQYFGLAQRRRRVFVVGCLGDWRRAAAVLFERHSLQGHPAPSREARKDNTKPAVAGTLGSNHGNIKAEHAWTGQLIVANTGDTAACLTHHAGRYDLDTETFVAACRTSGNCGAWETGDRVDALTTGTDPNSHLVQCITGDVAHTLKAEGFDASEDGTGRGQPIVNQAAGVRRLTPREAERLQGFPDDWTMIPWRGKPTAECPDGPRFKALGNSMAVPVMAWIGKRIEMVERLELTLPQPANQDARLPKKESA